MPLYFASKAKESQVDSGLNRDNIFIKIEEKFSALIVFFAKKPIYTILFFSVITIYTTFLAFKLESSFEVADFFNPESDFVLGLDKLDYHLGDTTGELGIFYFKGDLSEPEAINDMKSLLITLKSKDFLAHDKDGNLLIIEPNLISLLENINSPAINKEENKKNLDKLIDEGLKNDQDETIFSPSRIKTTLIRSNNNYSTVFRVGIPDSASQNITTLAREELENELKIFQNKNYITEYGITGSPFVRDVELSSSRNSLYRAIPIAGVASFLVLLIAFKSFRYAFVTVLPIGLVVSWLYGIMYIGGYSLNLVTATIGAISIGVGIDFSIHITQRFREEISRNNTETALSKTLNGTGIALLGSAISSIAGFIIMGFAPMPMFASFGQLTAIMIFLALISSVFVLPSLLVMVSKKNE